MTETFGAHRTASALKLRLVACRLRNLINFPEIAAKIAGYKRVFNISNNFILVRFGIYQPDHLFSGSIFRKAKKLLPWQPYHAPVLVLLLGCKMRLSGEMLKLVIFHPRQAWLVRISLWSQVLFGL